MFTRTDELRMAIWYVAADLESIYFIAHQEEGPFLILTVDGAFVVLPQNCVMFPPSSLF